MSTCASCGAAIEWATTASGKKMPLDAKPEKRVVLEGGPPWPPTGPTCRVVDTYVSHFATCPGAGAHRKPRDPKP